MAGCGGRAAGPLREARLGLPALKRLLLTLLLGSLPAAAAEAAVFRYVAVGDSITAGIAIPPDAGTCTAPPPTVQSHGAAGITGPECGYPPRLELLLGCGPTSCSIENEGIGSEQTAGALSRIDALLDIVPWDVMILKQGTNDVFGNVSNDTAEFNLKEMARKAALRGTDTVHASILWFHPGGSFGTTKDATVSDLGSRISAAASLSNRYFADQWAELCPAGLDRHGHLQGYCFDDGVSDNQASNLPASDHYTDVPPDPVGHPDADGFQMMAQRFEETITQSPIPGAPIPTSPIGIACDDPPTLSWSEESPLAATWYELEVRNSAMSIVHDDLYPHSGVFDGNDVLAIAGACAGGSCSATLPAALGSGDYAFRVRGRSPRGYGPWSNEAAFSIAVAGTPVLSLPANGQELFDTTPRYSWLPVPDATLYELVINGGTPQQYAPATVCTSPVCAVEPAAPVLPFGAADFKVRARNCNGFGSFSPVNAFTVVECLAPPSIDLDEASPVTDTRIETACIDVEVAKNGVYEIAFPGDVTIRAGEWVAIYNGFTVGLGAVLTVIVDP